MLGRRKGALVGMLLGGCLPKDDLDSYSGSAGASGEPSGGGPGTMRDAGGTAGVSGALPEPDAAAGGSAGGAPDVADAAPPQDGDAGVVPDAASQPLTDAGDAGTVLAAQCTSTGGTLEPGTRDCFFVSAAVLSWQNAVDACIARQSTLVGIKTPERDQFLTTLVSAPTWIGARDSGANPASNVFTWLDGTAASNVNNWASGEPDDVADQFCVAKTADTAAGPWRDRPCSEAHVYACERRF